MAATSPTNGSHLSGFGSPTTPHHGVKRSQSSAGFESSPGSNHDEDDGHGASKKAAQKRACNECRQQKLKCDVVQDPFTPCSRCRKQNLTCQVSANFKRIGKRSRHAEMEREAIDLKSRVRELEQSEAALKQQLASAGMTPSANFPIHNSNGLPTDSNQSTLFNSFLAGGQQYTGGTHDEAVSSLVSLKQGGFNTSPAFDNNNRSHTHHLGQVYLGTEQVEELFHEYFTHYHPFLPLLDPEQSPEAYMTQARILFWTIIIVAARHYQRDNTLLSKLTPAYRALLWTTISEVPQSYHIVKALCLLCTWPLPASSTTIDETFILAGVMMQVAMHHGLHQPSHAQDFSRTHVQLRDEDIKDRLSTWAVCNIVAHCVSVATGQPSTTLFDSALSFEHDHMDRLPESLVNHVMLERSAARITKALYSDSGSRSFYDDKSLLINYETTNLNDLEQRLRHSTFTGLDLLHLRAIRLNLQLYAFFNKQEHGWHMDLLNLLMAANEFLASIFFLEETSQLLYTTNYISQMMVAAGFTLNRLLNSNFANTIPQVQLSSSRMNFSRLITCIRQTSVRNNDLPQRLAEVLAQLWKAGGAGNPKITDADTFRIGHVGPSVDVSIHLKVRCRMSMSVVFDSLWHWREQFRGKGTRGNLDAAVNNPTDPETSSSTTPAPPHRGATTAAAATGSGSNSIPNSSAGGPVEAAASAVTTLDPNLPTLSLPTMTGSMSLTSGLSTAGHDMGPFADYTSDFFDPMSSILNDPIFFSSSSAYF
ncbi:uncharacterized protein K452DRAFT_151594 [Aplosporella prunicola CBS 121167]|uniref:Zn(2)-C6 fungal-type domain-containing protein n=1 Tax=Aplosporella prunicola CBS 121167 TaxID=1176127 RepID=A0A6A6BKV9_9PEZI|nr:uncharacterized protein K452DRAFT_151594 [Aplosporella prunicola CBS 121167]KAF2144023.1 hypothetical protein K452DRAFT_151594 [Aplosporella prunicola CBS 121167]